MFFLIHYSLNNLPVTQLTCKKTNKYMAGKGTMNDFSNTVIQSVIQI